VIQARTGSASPNVVEDSSRDPAMIEETGARSAPY
jgi:hypothetical protein